MWDWSPHVRSHFGIAILKTSSYIYYQTFQNIVICTLFFSHHWIVLWIWHLWNHVVITCLCSVLRSFIVESAVICLVCFCLISCCVTHSTPSQIHSVLSSCTACVNYSSLNSTFFQLSGSHYLQPRPPDFLFAYQSGDFICRLSYFSKFFYITISFLN